MAWVFAHSRSKNAERLVMLAVADACNSPDGTGAWLSNAALRAKTNLSERAVQAAVRGCEEIGELKVDRQAGRGGVNRFVVVMPIDPSVTEKVQNLRGNGKGAESAGYSESPQARGTKGAESAGLVAAGKGADSAPGTVSTKNSSSKSSSSAATKTRKPRADEGARLPDDFHATPAMIAWARENTPNVGHAETEAFIDHWRAQPGARGKKLDWLATWRNWMRRAQKDFDRQNRWTKTNRQGRRDEPAGAGRIPDDERCATHPSRRAAGCGLCRADANAAKARTS
jgi:hypothetical protein